MSAHEQEGDGGPERALDLPKVTQLGVSSHGLITSSLLPQPPGTSSRRLAMFLLDLLGACSGSCGS